MGLEEERWLFGAAMIRPDRLPVEALVLEPADFTGVGHGHLWAVILDMLSAGEEITAAQVAARLRANGSLRPDLIQWLYSMMDVPSVTGIGGIARGIRLAAVARRFRVELANTAEGLGPENVEESAERISRMAERFTAEAEPTASLPRGLTTYDNLDLEEVRKPWVIPGFLRQGWRYVLVAGEGVGKGVLLRQVAICAHNGVNPFTFRPMRPARTLTVDLENPDEVIAHQRDLVWRRLRQTEDASLAVPVFRRTNGLNIRDPRQFKELEKVIVTTTPELVVIGPLYKLFRSKPGEQWDQVAADVQERIDELRSRHGFAVMIEHHAPSQTGQGKRELVPFGAAMWKWWPEFGHALRRDGDTNRYKRERFRGDRIKIPWPDAFDRSEDGGWPWVPFWKEAPDLSAIEFSLEEEHDPDPF
jgi:hypothetical protein